MLILLIKRLGTLARYFFWRLNNKSQIKAGRVTVGQSSIYYESIGSGEPLVLLHGGGVLLESFAGQIPFFSKQYQIIAIDSRGHGRSSRGQKPLTYDTMAEDIVAVLSFLEIDNANFIGWSDGGNTGIMLALNYAQKVRSLVLISANYHPKGIDYPESINLGYFLKKIYQWFSPHPEKWVKLNTELNDLWRLHPQLSANDLTKISCKTLIIAGENDLVSLEHLKEMKAHIPKCELHIVQKGGHDVHVTHTNQINAVIFEHLNK